MKSDGRCHCGAITCGVEIDPVAICRRTDRRTPGGSALRIGAIQTR